MYIERDLQKQFEKIQKLYPVIAIVGARQAGKTTFLKEQMKKINASYLLFDDPDVRMLFEEDIKKFEQQYISGYEIAILDEVQYCKDAGRNLKYLAEKDIHIWITSSSEIILGKEVLSYLVGRVSILKLYPFSIPEFFIAKGQKSFTKKILERSIWEHMSYGGYPKVVTVEDTELKKLMLKDLYDIMILKDVARTFSIEDIKALELFTKYLALSIGNVISYENVSNALSLSFQTIKKYIGAMEKSYLLIVLQPFYSNKMKEITKRPKIYFLDTGLRNHIAKAFTQEPDGRLFENYVLSELIKMGFLPKYWRTKTKLEVDFVIEKDTEIIPIEVKLSAREKVERGLHSFISHYKPKRAFIVTYHSSNEHQKVNGCNVYSTDILHLWDYLKQ